MFKIESFVTKKLASKLFDLNADDKFYGPQFLVEMQKFKDDMMELMSEKYGEANKILYKLILEKEVTGFLISKYSDCNCCKTLFCSKKYDRNNNIASLENVLKLR